MILERVKFTPDGIFSSLSKDGENIAFTLEHAYPGTDDTWIAKIPNGTYTCIRGMHHLLHGAPFETFEITGVSGHSGLLFHKGNFDSDSEGCVLLGEEIVGNMVSNSAVSFENFMSVLTGIDSFPLTVE